MEPFYNGQIKRPDFFQWTRNRAGDDTPDGWIALDASEARKIPYDDEPGYQCMHVKERLF